MVEDVALLSHNGGGFKASKGTRDEGGGKDSLRRADVVILGKIELSPKNQGKSLSW